MSNFTIKTEPSDEIEEECCGVLSAVKLEALDERVRDYRSPVIVDDFFQAENHDVKDEILEKNSEQFERYYRYESIRRENQASERVHECDRCGKVFEFKKNLTAHMNVHNDTKIFKCEKCIKRFKTAHTLEAHLELHNGDRAIYECEKCERRFKSASGLWKHSEIHSNADYECGKTYKYKSAFLGHVKNHNEFGEYVCDVCRKSFRLKKYLQTHMSTHYEQSARPNELRKRAPLPTFRCGEYGRAFKRKRYFELHVNTHGVSSDCTCLRCDRTFEERSDFLEHIQFHDGSGGYECDLCGRTFEGRRKFIDHLKIHARTDEYECDSCGKTFKTKGRIVFHVATHESATISRIYRCDLCGKYFKTRRLLVQHGILHGHLNLHYSSPIHRCECCDKTFTARSSLTRHARTHITADNYSCDEYDIGTYLPTVHNGQTHERRKKVDYYAFYVCDICDKPFQQKGYLTKHINRVHKFSSKRTNC